MLNFNTEPYRDDFDPSKHFHRILFKPGRAVQARELTQSQTILQDQISKFAFHIFSQNTPVTGGQVTLNLDCYYLKLVPEFNETIVDVNGFLNRIIRDETGTVQAKVIAVSEATFVNDVAIDPPTLIISYISGQQFEDNDVIKSADDANYAARLITKNSTGKSSTAHISEGVYFIVNGYSYSSVKNADGTYSKYTIGHFVGVQPQVSILDKYSNEPTLRIGLSIDETIHDYVNDVSLLDPAVGSSNYQAPGADRFVIKLNLETRTLSIKDEQSFIELVRVDGGIIKRSVNSTVYSVIDEYFAKRTSETNGDFVSIDFAITPKADKNNPDNYIITVGKGVAYVNGFRIENQSDLDISGTRARSTANSNTSISFDYGNYIYVDSLSSAPNFNKLPKIDLHCVKRSSITSPYNSTLVGTAYLRNLEHYAGSVYRAFLTEIETRTITGQVAQATDNPFTIDLSDVEGVLSTNATSYIGVAISITGGRSVLDTRIISEYNSTTKVATVSERFTEVLDTSSTYSLKFALKDIESFVVQGTSNTVYANVNTQYGKDRGVETFDARLFATNEPEMIWPLGESFIKNVSGSSYQGTYTFETLQFSLDNNTNKISHILNISDITYSGVLPGAYFSNSGNLNEDQILNDFIVTDVTNNRVLTPSGNGLAIEVSNGGKTATFKMPPNYGTFTARISVKFNIISGDTSVKYKTLIRGNTAQYFAGIVVGSTGTYVEETSGQILITAAALKNVTQIQSLYISDVKRIVKILDTKNKNLNPSQIADFFTNSKYDVTSFYSFSNNQRDSYYDHSYIQLNFGASAERGNLLVIVDYYQHENKVGYFTGESYYNDTFQEVIGLKYIAKNGVEYKLNDCVDFRPARQNKTASLVFVDNYMIPNYLEEFSSSVEYYLPRKDLLIINKSRTFELIPGVPSKTPKFPSTPEGSLDLVKVTLDPYTAYITGENSKFSNIAVQVIPHKTWKMKNISDLESRVNNIEYYTSLSILEKNAKDLQIKDANGLNRFKYGILVDDFTNFSTAETSDYDFNCAINRLHKHMTAAHTIFNYPLKHADLSRFASGSWNESNLFSSLGFRAHNTDGSKYFTLNYTSVTAIQQRLASRTINVNPLGVIDRVGLLSISPTMDTYVDNLKLPSLMIHDPNMTFWEPTDSTNIINQSEWKMIPGTYIEGKLIGDVTTPLADGSQKNVKTFEDTWIEDQTTRYGNYKQLNANFIETNGFITDVNIMPYIRHQPLTFKVKNLLTNTPLNCVFDGVNVNDYIQLPNLIEVSVAANKAFQEEDIVGYVDSNSGEFIYRGRVLGTASNLDGFVLTPHLIADGWPITQYLYVIDDFGNNTYSTTGQLHRGYYNTSTRKYSKVSDTDVGTITAVLNNSGFIVNANGTRTNIELTTDETGRDYRTITKASVIAKYETGKTASAEPTLGNVVYPKTEFAERIKHVVRYSNVTQVKISATATSTNEFYTGEMFSVFSDSVATNSVVTEEISAYDGERKVITLKNPISFDVSVDRIVTTPPAVGASSGATQIQLPKTDSTLIIRSGMTISGDTIDFAGNYTITAVNSSSSNVVITLNKAITQNITTEDDLIVEALYFNNGVGREVTATASIYTITRNTSIYRREKAPLYSGTRNNPISMVESMPLMSSPNGMFCGIFNIPGGTFYSGSKVFRIDNSINSNANSATTYAEATFFASNLSTQSQSLQFGSVIPGYNITEKDPKRRVYDKTTIIPPPPRPTDPLAQTFLIPEESYHDIGGISTQYVGQGALIFPNGAFLNSITLFFRTRSVVTPISLFVVETENGIPNTSKILENSAVVLNPWQINTSERPHYLDNDTKTVFKFNMPIYVKPGILYAIVLKSNSTDYNLWLAAQNDLVLPSTFKELPTDVDPDTTEKLNGNPYLGAIFESQNAITWTPSQTKSLMFLADVCKFTNNYTPRLDFVAGRNLQSIRNPSIDAIYHELDEQVISNTGLFLTKDIEYDAFNVSTTDFVPPGTNIQYSYQTTPKTTRLLTETKVSVNPGKYGTPTAEDILLTDGKGTRIIDPKANDSFVLSATLKSNDYWVSPVICDEGISLFTTNWLVSDLGVYNYNINVINGGFNYKSCTIVKIEGVDGYGSGATASPVLDASGTITSVNVLTSGTGYAVRPKVVVETYNTGSTTANSNTMTLTISGGYISNGNVYSGQIISNTANANQYSTIVSANSANGYVLLANAVFGTQGSGYFKISGEIPGIIVNCETCPNTGNGLAKYITKKVTLAAGQEAGDLRVYYTAYRPLNTDIFVYYKILSPEDNQAFDDGNWQILTPITTAVNKYSKSRSELIEFVVAPGTGFAANNNISYISKSNGVKYTTFNQFAIKVVLMSKDKTFVPFLNDIRAIALPAGTGMG